MFVPEDMKQVDAQVKEFLVFYGCFTVKADTKNIHFSYTGNMGTGMDTVERCMCGIGLPGVLWFRTNCPTAIEEGSPDYLWTMDIPVEKQEDVTQLYNLILEKVPHDIINVTMTIEAHRFGEKRR